MLQRLALNGAMSMFSKVRHLPPDPGALPIRRLYSSLIRGGPTLQRIDPLRSRHIHGSPLWQFPRRRDFFSSNATLQRSSDLRSNEDHVEEQHTHKRKTARSPAGKTSLRRVAVEAQRTRDGIVLPGRPTAHGLLKAKVNHLRAGNGYDGC